LIMEKRVGTNIAKIKKKNNGPEELLMSKNDININSSPTKLSAGGELILADIKNMKKKDITGVMLERPPYLFMSLVENLL